MQHKPRFFRMPFRKWDIGSAKELSLLSPALHRGLYGHYLCFGDWNPSRNKSHSAKLPGLGRITMMSCDFLKIIMKKSSCCWAHLTGNCRSIQRSALEKNVAAVQVEENKCLEENNTNVTSSARRMTLVLFFMLCFDNWECRSWFEYTTHLNLL